MSELEIFREKIDADTGLAGKRTLLITCSLILLALNVSGAKILEANTFILKLSFENHDGLLWLLNISVIYLLIRYNAYAQAYHAKLSTFWSMRMINDPVLLHFNKNADPHFTGLLEKVMPDVLLYESDALSSLKYEIKSLLTRNLTYTTNNQNQHNNNPEEHKETIKLNEYRNTWHRIDMLILFKHEFKYRAEALIRYREGLDLLAPYIIGLSAILPTIYRLIK